MKFSIGQQWEQPVFASLFERRSSSKQSTERNRPRDICGWPERSVSAWGHRWALPLLCAFLICHSEMLRRTEEQTVVHASRHRDGKWVIKRRRDRLREGEAKDSERENDREHKRPAVWTFGVSLLALGHYLAPLLHHVLLLICHTARGSPAYLSRGPAVTVLMPKITSANGREAEGTDQ